MERSGRSLRSRRSVMQGRRNRSKLTSLASVVAEASLPIGEERATWQGREGGPTKTLPSRQRSRKTASGEPWLSSGCLGQAGELANGFRPRIPPGAKRLAQSRPGEAWAARARSGDLTEGRRLRSANFLSGRRLCRRFPGWGARRARPSNRVRGVRAALAKVRQPARARSQ